MEDIFHTKIRIPNGIDIYEPETSGPVVEDCTCSDIRKDVPVLVDNHTSWCYLFIHHAKVRAFIETLRRDMMIYFVHKSVIYLRSKHTRGVKAIKKPTISGLVFLQGSPKKLQHYLDTKFSGYHLVNNCSTHLPAIIPDTVMQPFIRVLEVSPDRVRFLLHPFKYYAGGNVKLRITSGFLAGLEGYVIRIDRDRRLVMDVGGMSVAISGIHCEKFEVVGTDQDHK